MITFLRVSLAFLLVLLAAAFGQPAAGLGEGWSGEFALAARQTLQLAEATPPEKFSWRPAPGIRSISEVYMHTAIANHGLLMLAGTPLKGEAAKLEESSERKITAKADVVRWLKGSQDAVRQAYASLDRKKKVKFLGKDVTADEVFLRILVHNHEHMGQSIAYARMNGIAPPWSKRD